MYLVMYGPRARTAKKAIKALGERRMEELMGLLLTWQDSEEMDVYAVIKDFFEEHGLNWRWWYGLWVEQRAPKTRRDSIVIHKTKKG